MTISYYAVAILAIGLLIALHEGGHFFAARWTGMTVLRYSIGFLHPIIKWTSQKTNIIYQLGILPLGGFVQIKGMNPYEEGAYEDADSYMNMAAWRRMLVVIAGPICNLALAWLLLFGLYMYGFPQSVSTLEMEKIVKDGPADKAGILKGDEIKTFDGHELKSWAELVMALQAHPDTEVTLGVLRNGKMETLKVTPSNVNGVGKVGIWPVNITKPMQSMSIVDSASIASVYFWKKWVVQTFGLLAGIFSPGDSGAETIGPVGIVKVAAQEIKRGFASFLALAAYLSFMLGLFNLLPLPALDGGRATFLVIEMISRRRIPPKADAIVNMAGFVLLMGLLLLMTFKDIFG